LFVFACLLVVIGVDFACLTGRCLVGFSVSKSGRSVCLLENYLPVDSIAELLGKCTDSDASSTNTFDGIIGWFCLCVCLLCTFFFVPCLID
jgi:hypothetical protein